MSYSKDLPYISYNTDPTSHNYMWVFKDGKRLNFYIKDTKTYLTYVLVQHIINGQIQGQKWLELNKLLIDPAATYYDGKLNWIPLDSYKINNK